MTYFQKHYLRASAVTQTQNTKPAAFMHPRKQPLLSKSGQDPLKQGKSREKDESRGHRAVLGVRGQGVREQSVLQRGLPGLMVQGDSSMQQLLNSSINQFTKYLSDRHPFQQQHQQLLAQNQSLRASLQGLKSIIKQKLQRALSRQREQLNAVMQDYVQLITKLLADKQELTAALEQLEGQLAESQQRCEGLVAREGEAQGRIEELGREREQHIAKTKQQIDDFLQIIEQYEQQAEQEGKEGEELRQRIAYLQQQLSYAEQRNNGEGASAKTQALLELLERAQEENRLLREGGCRGGCEQRLQLMEREHEQEFMQYQRAMRETLSKKDECIARLTAIIESCRSQRGA